jgi:two-component system chemotaxis response regulator CheY
MRILVVDDEPEYRLIMRSILTSEGHEVILAENGEDALEKLEGGGMDIVVTDIYMPVMDGIKFHRTARTKPGLDTVPFLFVSAFDDQHTLEAVKDPRYDGFLRKARPVEELLEWIKYLSTPEADRPKMPPGPMPLKAKRTPDSGRAGTRGQSGTRYY